MEALGGRAVRVELVFHATANPRCEVHRSAPSVSRQTRSHAVRVAREASQRLGGLGGWSEWIQDQPLAPRLHVRRCHHWLPISVWLPARMLSTPYPQASR